MGLEHTAVLGMDPILDTDAAKVAEAIRDMGCQSVIDQCLPQ